MWPWIKRWRDWAMTDLLRMHRTGLQPQGLHYSYEKAGLTLDNQPVPWNAEAVLVEAVLRLPASTGRRKADFVLRLPEREPVPAESLRREDTPDDRCRLFFRLPVPDRSLTAELLWRNHPLGQVSLPILSREEFVQRLTLQMPTLSVSLGEQTVACQTFVATQCRGVVATALLTSPTSLAPVHDLGLQVEFRNERGGSAHRVPVPMTSSQLRSRQALITVAPRKFPRRIGTWLATWLLEDRPLASQRIRAISKSTFHRSLRISETRFLVQGAKGEVTLARHPPGPKEAVRVGPCFLVSSREVGMAGVCKLQAHVQVAGAVQPPLLCEQEVLITDGPTPFAPGTLDAADLDRAAGFELRVRGRSLGSLPLAPAPTANFTSEGGFKAPTDFTWSAAAEDQLAERLGKLMEGTANGP
jgi:hypothetical protein